MQPDTASLAGAAALAFVSTDVDNFLLVTAQFAAAPAERVRRIAAGQFVGFLVLVAAAAAVAAALFDIPTRWVGLLGLVPIAIGLRALVAWRRPPGPGQRPTMSRRWPTAGGAATAALITIGSGGDNLAVYIPLFKGVGVGGHGVVIGVFLVCESLLLGLAHLVGRHHLALRTVDRVGAAVTPFLYVTIGVVVLLRSGTFSGIF